MVENKEIENKILEILKEGEKSTSEISSIISRNFYYTFGALQSLESQKKVKRREVGKYIFWRIK